MDELYHLKVDPMEMNNLAEVKPAPEVLKGLQKQLLEHLRATGDKTLAGKLAAYWAGRKS